MFYVQESYLSGKVLASLFPRNGLRITFCYFIITVGLTVIVVPPELIVVWSVTSSIMLPSSHAHAVVASQFSRLPTLSYTKESTPEILHEMFLDLVD
jgi:hypothetical protein